MRFWLFALAVCSSLHATSGYALNSDRKQPATIEADEAEFDFRTGKRIYRGDVIVIQGTLKITGDKMEIQYNDDETIETATSWGNPATFKQRPEGKEEDVYGEGQTIILHDPQQTLTLIENAVMIQAGNTAKGKEIVYRIDEDRMTVKGLRQKEKEDGGGTTTDTKKPTRARVIIKPEAKPEDANQKSEEKSSEAGNATESDKEPTGGESEEEPGLKASE